MNEEQNFCYFPPKSPKQYEKSTCGVKFCNDTYLTESFLKQNEIDYSPSDLEDSPLGLVYRIKKG